MKINWPIACTANVDERYTTASFRIEMPAFQQIISAIITRAFVHLHFTNSRFGRLNITAGDLGLFEEQANWFAFLLVAEAITVAFASAESKFLTLALVGIIVPWKRLLVFPTNKL